MDERHRTILRKGRVILLKDISAIDNLCDKLFAYGVLTEGMVAEIKAENGREPQARKLLDILPRRGKDAFDFFYQSLVETDQQELANILCPELAPRHQVAKSPTSEQIGKGKTTPDFTPENVEPLKVELKKCNRDQIMKSFPSCYKMESGIRGKLIIINNFEFKDHVSTRDQQCHTLSGTSMQLLFEKLKFKVETHNNVDSSKKLLAIIAKEQTNDDQYDCFAMMILTHGHDDVVCMTDMEELKIQNIIDEFDSVKCPKMNGKPKLFFIHACPTESKQPTIIDLKSVLPHSHEDSHTLRHADIFIARATLYDPILNRDESKGFWFIQAFVHVMKYHAHDTDLVDMMTKVNELATEDEQLCDFRYTLRKKLFFFPGA